MANADQKCCGTHLWYRYNTTFEHQLIHRKFRFHIDRVDIYLGHKIIRVLEEYEVNNGGDAITEMIEKEDYWEKKFKRRIYILGCAYVLCRTGKLYFLNMEKMEFFLDRVTEITRIVKADLQETIAKDFLIRFGVCFGFGLLAYKFWECIS